MPDRPNLTAVPDATQLMLSRRPAAGGCPHHGALMPGLTAALALRWELVDEQLRQVVADTTYEIWLASLRLHHFGDVEVRVAAPPTTASWIRDRFGRVLERACSEVAGGPRRVVVEVCGS